MYILQINKLCKVKKKKLGAYSVDLFMQKIAICPYLMGGMSMEIMKALLT